MSGEAILILGAVAFVGALVGSALFTARRR